MSATGLPMSGARPGSREAQSIALVSTPGRLDYHPVIGELAGSADQGAVEGASPQASRDRDDPVRHLGNGEELAADTPWCAS